MNHAVEDELAAAALAIRAISQTTPTSVNRC
jgi:hypothetical protein